MDIEKTIRALTGRGFAVQHFATGREAADYLDGAIDGTTVGIGGSKTIDQIGLYDRLTKHNTVWWHWRTPGFDTLDHALTAPVYLSSANAITADGQILNIDGRGNRLAAMVYGIGKTVYIVAGTNKICPDFDSALSRARNTAAVQNMRRFDGDQPCHTVGRCLDCRSKSLRLQRAARALGTDDGHGQGRGRAHRRAARPVRRKGMKVFKRIKWSYVVLSAMFLLLGIYLVVNPETSLVMICRILGAAMAVFGVMKIVLYFIREVKRVWPSGSTLQSACSASSSARSCSGARRR